MKAAARLTIVEAAIAKLADRLGPRLSAGRAQLLAGTLPPVVHDVSVLEAEAKLPGLRGAMAAGQLRILRWAPQDGLDEAGGTETPAEAGNAPTAAPVDPATGPSELVTKIDRLMRRV